MVPRLTWRRSLTTYLTRRYSTISGSTGGRCSTEAGSTARRACSASLLTPDRLSESQDARLVGNAGQRVQGFLSKLGLTRSYVCLNAWAYAVHPSRAFPEKDRLDETAQLEWRNDVYDAATGPQLEAVIAFGFMAQAAVALWPNIPNGIEPRAVPHPSNPEEEDLLAAWREAIDELRDVVTPDADGDNTGPNYGSTFEESDYAPIPRRDLPFGAPAFLGDDSWVRAKPGQAMNSVSRPSPDDFHTLTWHAPDSSE